MILHFSIVQVHFFWLIGVHCTLFSSYEILPYYVFIIVFGIEIGRELASRADQRVLRWFGHVERMDEYRIARRVLMAEVSGGRVRGRPRLGWMDGVNVTLGRQQRNDCGGCASMPERSERVGEPWYISN